MSQQKHPCPICGYLTLNEPRAWNVCPVCFWEDGGDYPDEVTPSGCNNNLTVNEAKRNFAEFGACERDMLANVRSPKPEEMPKLAS